MRQDDDSLLPFVVEALNEKPGLDLSELSGPWMWLRHRGFTHLQISQHIDKAIERVRAERAIATAPYAERVTV